MTDTDIGVNRQGTGVTEAHDISTGEWFHFVAVDNGSQYKWYIGGVSIGTDNRGGTVGNLNSFIGWDNGLGAPWKPFLMEQAMK